jgi:hypothetical protein
MKTDVLADWWTTNIKAGKQGTWNFAAGAGTFLREFLRELLFIVKGVFKVSISLSWLHFGVSESSWLLFQT